MNLSQFNPRSGDVVTNVTNLFPVLWQIVSPVGPTVFGLVGPLVRK